MRILVVDDIGNVLGVFSSEDEAYNFAKEKMKEGKKIRIIAPAELYTK
ncbi:hypothetical protein [Acidianus infernus]